ncbi:MAG: hypothetical protein V2J51_00950, partial [Erythrobacter sp.]|nr:hypothetical protein [Erythrobacter sp.]
MLKRLALLGALGYTGYRFATRDRRSAPAYGEGEAHDGVRNAGPAAARDESGRNWTEVDEE